MKYPNLCATPQAANQMLDRMSAENLGLVADLDSETTLAHPFSVMTGKLELLCEQNPKVFEYVKPCHGRVTANRIHRVSYYFGCDSEEELLNKLFVYHLYNM